MFEDTTAEPVAEPKAEPAPEPKPEPELEPEPETPEEPGDPDAPHEDEPAPEPEAEPAPAPKPEDLPEGVTVKEGKDGKKFWTYPENRARTIYADHQKARAAEEIMQEPLTPEAVHARENALRDMEWMRLDFLSGDPRKQASVFTHFLKQAKAAVDRGEVAADPTPIAAMAFIDLLEKHAPEAHAAVADKFKTDKAATVKSFVRETYRKAVASGVKGLMTSAQWMAKELTGDYKWLDEAEPAPDPNEARLHDVEARENRLREHVQQQERSAIETWNQTTVTQVNEEVQGAIGQALEVVKKSYEKYPKRLKSLSDQLEKEVRSAIQSDEAWRQTNEQLYTRASLARSEEIRQEVRDRLAKRYAAKARSVIDRVKAEIFSEDAIWLKTQNVEQRNRQGRAKERTTPATAGSPATPRLPVTPKSGAVGRGDWENFVDSAFGS